MFIDCIIVFLFLSIFGLHIYTYLYKKSVRERMSVTPQIRRQILIDLYKLIYKVSVNSGTKPFIIYGTLLGYVRNKDLICYDFDLDFGISNDEYLKFKEELYKINNDKYTILIKKYLTYETIEIIDDDTRISADIFQFKIENGKVQRLVSPTYSVSYLGECTAYYPEEWIYPLKQVEFLGKGIYIPNDAPKLLECYYGKDYIIPDTKCDASCNNCKKIKKKEVKN
jgi:phosphorylcholine metabolism protein LicD